MVGVGRVADLPEELQQPVAGVMIYEGATGPDGMAPVDGRGRWEVLDPGRGPTLGPELGFYKHAPIILRAQEAFVDGDANEALVSADGVEFGADGVHYSAAGLVELGRRLAIAMAELEG